MLSFGKTAARSRSLISLLQPCTRQMCSEGPGSTYEQAGDLSDGQSPHHTHLCPHLFLDLWECPITGVLGAYERLVESGRLKPDQNQHACAQRFQGLLEELSIYAPAVEKYEEVASAYRQSRHKLRQKLVDRDRERARAEGVAAMRR